jgi:AbrB family looped-hinge helix DNA binding protein
MAVSTLTSKGQITLPKSVRDKLNLKTGDKIEFRVESDGSVTLLPIAKKVSEVFGVFAFKGSSAPSKSELKMRLAKAFKEGKL